jgi:hypothetical protein
VKKMSRTGSSAPFHFGWPVQIPMRLEIFGVPAPADVLPQTQRLQTKMWSTPVGLAGNTTSCAWLLLALCQ